MKQLFPIGILLSGILYIFVVDTGLIVLELTTKLIPMLLIIFYAARQWPAAKSILIGLSFCALGDALIIFSFLPGLAAFLVGHLFYIHAFMKQRQFRRLRLSILFPLIIFGAFMGTSLITTLKSSGNEAFILPVILYLIIISFMGFAAFQTDNKYLYAGSILFIISDAVLAWNLFIEDVMFSGEIIMLTYYGAQFLIAHSLTRAPARSK